MIVKVISQDSKESYDIKIDRYASDNLGNLILEKLVELNMMNSQLNCYVETNEELIFYDLYEEEGEFPLKIPRYYCSKNVYFGLTVLRIENQYGLGPYTNNKEINKLIKEENKVRGELPEYDGFPKEALDALTEKKGLCGFLNMTQLNKWFSEDDIILLSKLGYFIKEYNTKECWIGMSQVIFIP